MIEGSIQRQHRDFDEGSGQHSAWVRDDNE